MYRAELVVGEGVDVCYWLAAQGAADELHVVALDVRHHHDVHLGKGRMLL